MDYDELPPEKKLTREEEVDQAFSQLIKIIARQAVKEYMASVKAGAVAGATKITTDTTKAVQADNGKAPAPRRRKKKVADNPD